MRRTGLWAGTGEASGACGKELMQFQAQGISHSHQGNLKVVLKGPVCPSDPQLLGVRMELGAISSLPETHEIGVEQVESTSWLTLLGWESSASRPISVHHKTGWA